MSIQSEINRINDNIAQTYQVAEQKGATLPETQDSNNLANTVLNIPTGGINQEEADGRYLLKTGEVLGEDQNFLLSTSMNTMNYTARLQMLQQSLIDGAAHLKIGVEAIGEQQEPEELFLNDSTNILISQDSMELGSFDTINQFSGIMINRPGLNEIPISLKVRTDSNFINLTNFNIEQERFSFLLSSYIAEDDSYEFSSGLYIYPNERIEWIHDELNAVLTLDFIPEDNMPRLFFNGSRMIIMEDLDNKLTYCMPITGAELQGYQDFVLRRTSSDINEYSLIALTGPTEIDEISGQGPYMALKAEVLETGKINFFNLTRDGLEVTVGHYNGNNENKLDSDIAYLNIRNFIDMNASIGNYSAIQLGIIGGLGENNFCIGDAGFGFYSGPYNIETGSADYDLFIKQNCITYSGFDTGKNNMVHIELKAEQYENQDILLLNDYRIITEDFLNTQLGPQLKGILTQEQYDALDETEQNKGVYIIDPTSGDEGIEYATTKYVDDAILESSAQKVVGLTGIGGTPTRTVAISAAELNTYIDNLPKLITEYLTIEVNSGTTTSIIIKNFYGPGQLTIKAKEGGNVSISKMQTYYNKVTINIYDLNFTNSNNTLLDIYASDIRLKNCSFSGTGSTGIGLYAMARIGANLCQFNNLNRPILCTESSTASMINCTASENTNGAHVNNGGIILLSGTTPNTLGGTSNTKQGGIIVDRNGQLL